MTGNDHRVCPICGEEVWVDSYLYHLREHHGGIALRCEPEDES